MQGGLKARDEEIMFFIQRDMLLVYFKARNSCFTVGNGYFKLGNNCFKARNKVFCDMGCGIFTDVCTHKMQCPVFSCRTRGGIPRKGCTFAIQIANTTDALRMSVRQAEAKQAISKGQTNDKRNTHLCFQASLKVWPGWRPYAQSRTTCT